MKVLLLLTLISVSASASSLTERVFNRAIDRVESAYKEEFSKKNLTLSINRKWKSDDAIAYASQIGNSALISISGGFRRFDYFDENSIIFVVCHEVGHFLGGSPKNHDPKHKLLSVEGQADYFATAKCLKTVLKNDPQNARIAKDVVLEDEVKENCAEQFKTKDDLNICLIGSELALKIGKFVNDNRGSSRSEELSLLTPDSRRVFWRSLDLYEGDVQCRMDTVYQGALCNESADSSKACDEVSGKTMGHRPRCWFRPSR